MRKRLWGGGWGGGGRGQAVTISDLALVSSSSEGRRGKHGSERVNYIGHPSLRDGEGTKDD